MKKLLFLGLFLFSITSGFCQPLSSYRFCAFDSTYVPLPSSLPFLTPDASYGGGGYYDDDSYNNIPIGFNFVYCGATYTMLSASANCYLTLGETMPVSTLPWTFCNDLDNLGGPFYGYTGGTYLNLPRPILAALWTDILTAGANVRYNTVGTPGNRVFTIEWTGVSFYPSFTPFENVEIKLYETSNWIDFRYSNLGSGPYSLGYCGIGITGGVGAIGSPGASGVQPYWSLNNASGAPTPSMTINTRSIAGQPATNQVYRWLIFSMTTTATNSGPVCAGGTINLTGTVTGGTGVTYLWTGPGGYTSTLLSPTITGITTTGAGIYTFTATSGCFSSSSTTTVVVNPMPAAISGTLSICNGSTTTLADATGGGVWTSGSIGVATVGSTTGIVTAVATGTAVITYMIAGGCYVTAVVTVNPLPAAITGIPSVCIGLTTTLADITAGGTWSSGTPGVATVGATTGIVTGVSAGTANITYTITIGGCNVVQTITVNPSPVSIAGATSVCAGSTTTLTDGTAGGSWSSSNILVATIGGTGVVTGVSPGTTTITYTLGTGCYTIFVLTVNITPLPITGVLILCAGNTTTLTDPTAGGTWSSVTPGVATISGSGVVSGVLGGTSVISYTIGSCAATTIVTINPVPAPISGITSVCIGLTTALSETTLGGTWSSSNIGVATISSTGVVTGVATGTATISYTLPTGCFTTTIVTVNSLPQPITGTDSVCVGASITLADATPGGAWASSSPGIATVGAATGIVTAVSAGTVTITYGGGCFITKNIIVHPIPAVITGVTSVCLAEGTTTLSDITGGGIWSSSNIGIAAITGTGVVTGVTTGTAVISYTLIPTGCFVTTIVTVNPLPLPITGADTVCVGSSTFLNDGSIGGTWASSLPAIATVGAGTGLVTGVSAGNTTITYSLTATGCYVTTTFNVRPLPLAITGISNVCAGEGATTLSDGTPGGLWSSSNTAIAVIGGLTGIVTGVTSGTVSISYTLPTSCYITQLFTVNPLPLPIIGIDSVCVGSSTLLSDGMAGGSWSSSNIAIVTIGAATGMLTGVSTGTVTITYTMPTGCYVTFTETVHPLPAAITGLTSAVCQGLTITLTDATAGGNWSSSNVAIAIVGGGTGIVTGISAGTVNISYTLSTGCYVTNIVTVNPLPAAIGGPNSVCLGQTITETETTIGGTWTSSNLLVTTIGAGTGIINGLSIGTTIITYTLGTGCIMTKIVTVNPLPAAITGPVDVCVGATITINDIVGGGAWSCSNAAIATVALVTVGTGAVTGVSAGSVTISYMIGTGCYVTELITVHPLPSAITGPVDVCEAGGTATLADATAGGTWSSANSAIATVGTTTGVITGVVPGVTLISYTITATGCVTTAFVTVHPLPVAINGDSTLCVNSSIILTGVATGGTWTSSPLAIATIGLVSGIVTGVSSGTATITYTVANNCYITKPITINALPPATITPLGDTLMCPGAFVILLANTGMGLTYQWYNSGVPVAGAIATTLYVNATGVYSVYETNAAGCTTFSNGMHVSVIPPFAHITLPTSDTFCAGTSLTLFANTGAGLSYQWKFAGTAIAGATNSFYGATAAGQYLVVVTNPAGCSASDSIIVYTHPAPIPVIMATGPVSFCVGDSVRLIGTIGSYTYQWSVGGIPIPGATNITYTTSNSGNFTLTETNTIGCSGTSVGIIVSANPLPITVITASGATTFCTGGNVLLSVPNTVGCIYQWYNMGVPIIGATSSSYLATASGTFTVRVLNTVTGCTDITAIPVVVVLVTSAAVIPLTPTSFCWGSSATLAIDIFGATGVSYQWMLNGVIIPGAVNSTLNTNTPGVYTCTVIIGSSCMLLATPLVLTENPLPDPIITWIAPNLVTQNYFVSYQWYRNMVSITGANFYIYTPYSIGNYTVRVTDTNGCQSVSDIFILTSLVDTTGGGGTHGSYVEPINNGNDYIKIYPNPANTIVHIESNLDLKAIITCIDGRKLIEKQNASEINITDIANGAYLIMLYDSDGQLVKVEKLIKQ